MQVQGARGLKPRPATVRVRDNDMCHGNEIPVNALPTPAGRLIWRIPTAKIRCPQAARRKFRFTSRMFLPDHIWYETAPGPRGIVGTTTGWG